MVKKRTAKKATPTKQPARMQAVAKRKPTQAVVHSAPREPLKKVEKWPAVEQLLEQAHACRNFAETLRQNILTTDPNCPLRLPTVRGNGYAIQEAIDRVRKAYVIYRPFPNTRYPSLVRVAGTCILGWGHLIDLPARNLILAINGLFIYCEREPLTPLQFGFDSRMGRTELGQIDLLAAIQSREIIGEQRIELFFGRRERGRHA